MAGRPSNPRIGCSALPDRSPYPFGSGGHIQVANAEFGEGIEDRVHDSGRGGNRPGLAAALYAKGIVQTGKTIPGKVERRTMSSALGKA